MEHSLFSHPRSANPKHAEWDALAGGELEQPLRDGWIRLLDAQWLIGLAESGGVLRRRQDLPEEAFISLDSLKDAGTVQGTGSSEWLRLIVLSMPWLQPGHPDRFGETLHIVAQAVKVFVKETGNPYGVMIDFGSLFQADRTDEENKIFKLALPHQHSFFSHQYTVGLNVTTLPLGYPSEGRHRYVLPHGANIVPYAQRGWTFAEVAMNCLVKGPGNVLDLGALQTGVEDLELKDLILGSNSGTRVPPLDPYAFKVELNKKTFTSKKDDFEKVWRLYVDAFNYRFLQVRKLDYRGFGWDGETAQRLAEALQHATYLKELDLSNNAIGDDGLAALCKVLSGTRTFEELRVQHNNIGNAGAVVLSETLLGRNGALKILDLSQNTVHAEGAVRLAEALDVKVELTCVHLQHNPIGPDGLKALTEVVKRKKDMGNLSFALFL